MFKTTEPIKKMIVATSSSCLDYLPTPKNVAILPINVHIGSEDYLDGQDIGINEISRQILEHPKLVVRTSAPDEGQLIEFFYELIEKGVEEIMVVTISSYLSKTYQNIHSIQSIFGSKLTIHLVDSRTISHGEAVLVYEAAKMLDEGKDFPTISRRLNQMRDKQHMYITVDNVKTMVKTKRLSGPAGFVATLFDIKPVVFVELSGKIIGYEKIRGFEESVYRVVELVQEASEGKKGSFYTACNDVNPHAPLFYQAIRDFGFTDVFHAPLASVCVANVGVYALGMMFMED